jgi:hypothetical protein
MKYWKQKLATYVYNHCNICNTPIYFYNIRMKYLQPTYKTYETLETYACNMRSQAQHLLAAWTKWRLINAELDAGAEFNATKW